MPGGQDKCLSCGDTTHLSRDCPKKCKDCGFSFCGLNSGRACPVTAQEEMPPKEKITNFFNRPIPDALYGLLLAKRVEINGKKAAAADGGASAHITFFDHLAFHVDYTMGDFDFAFGPCVECVA